VIFDLGGVVMPSPLDAFREYERHHDLPHRFLSEIVLAGGDDGAWSKLERGELTMEQFATAFEAECAAAGGTVIAADVFTMVHEGSGPRPEMLTAVARIREEGLNVAALTNNWKADDPGSSNPVSSGSALLGNVFDIVVESSVEGLRKPDPRIYEATCERLGVQPSECVFLDDLGVNLKPARALGMATIKVGDPATALAELADILGFSLAGSR
jgi:putative hydrolase of the HAD superfamily